MTPRQPASVSRKGTIDMAETLTLNNCNLAAVGELVQAIQENPQKAQTTWAATVDWKGGFRSEATVREFAPRTSDEPTALGGDDTAPNPVEQVLSALGNCLAVGYAAGASAAGIELNDLRIDLEGDIDLHTFLGLGAGNAGYEGIKVRVSIDSDASQELLDDLHQKVVATSPVGHTLSQPVPVDIALT